MCFMIMWNCKITNLRKLQLFGLVWFNFDLLYHYDGTHSPVNVDTCSTIELYSYPHLLLLVLRIAEMIPTVSPWQCCPEQPQESELDQHNSLLYSKSYCYTHR